MTGPEEGSCVENGWLTFIIIIIIIIIRIRIIIVRQD